jgi:hypothetical protein
MDLFVAVVSVGVAVNTIINFAWYFIITDIRDRIRRLEDIKLNQRNK